MTRPERVSSIQALAWLNPIVEDDSGNESEGENVFQGLDQGSANLKKVRPTWKAISSDGSDSGTDINDLEQTDSASYQLVSFGSGSNDTSTATKAQGCHTSFIILIITINISPLIVICSVIIRE